MMSIAPREFWFFTTALFCIGLLPGTSLATTQSNGSSQDGQLNLGKFECVYLERANGDKHWSVNLANAELRSLGDRLFITGGGKGNRDVLLNFRKLLVLEKPELQPMDLNRVPNSVQSRDWNRFPLNQIVVAKEIAKGGSIELVADGDPLVRAVPWKMITNDIPFEKMDRIHKSLYRVRGTDLDLAMDFKLPAFDKILTGYFHQDHDDGPVVLTESDSIVNSLSIKAFSVDNESFAISPLGRFRIPYDASQIVKHRIVNGRLILIRSTVQNIVEEITMVDWTSGKESAIFSANDQKRIVESNWISSHNNALFFRKKFIPFFPTPVGYQNWQSEIHQLDLATGKFVRKIVSPKGYAFTNCIRITRGGDLYVSGQSLGRRTVENGIVHNNEQVVFRVGPDESVAEIVARLPKVVQAIFQKDGDMAIDQDHIYFVGSLPTQLRNYRNGDRKGNAAIYRYPLSEVKKRIAQ